MKKITCIIPTLNVGGTELFLLSLMKEFSTRNNHVQVVTLLGNGNLTNQFIAIDNLTLVVNKTSKTYVETIRKIKLFKPHAIITFLYPSDIFSLVLFVLNKHIPIIWNVRNSKLEGKFKIFKLIILFLLGFISYFVPKNIVFVSQKGLKLHKKFLYSGTKSVYIPNWCRLVKTCEPKLYDKKQSIRLCCMGRFSSAKNYINIFKSFYLLDNINVSLCVNIAGRNVEKEWVAWKNVNEISFSSQFSITFVEHINDVQTFFRDSNFFLLASLHEGFPNVLLESVLSGCFPIVTNAGDSFSIVQDFGVKIKGYTSHSIQKGIMDAFSYTPEKIAHNVFQLQKLIKSNFQKQKIIDKYLALV